MTLRAVLSRYANQTHGRTATKTVLYRVVMILVTIIVALLVTGRLDQALSIGIVANIVKTGTYYGYERLWAHVTWGTSTKAA